MSEQSSYSPVATPPSTPGLPQNPVPIVYDGFSGLNTKASQQGIQDQEMFVCDGFMPLGPNNLRCLPGLGAAIYTASGGRTIVNFSFNNLGDTAICAVCLSDGSIDQVNVETLAVTQIATPGSISVFPPDFTQWAGQYLIFVADQTNGYFIWDGTHAFRAGTVSPQVVVINGGSGYTSAPTVNISTGAQASGSVFFPANPSPGDTVTFNGVVYTFIAGATSGTNIHIDITCGVTIAVLENALNTSTNPAISVATYAETGGPSDATLHVTYDYGGTAGNAYTMTASAATPSGATLTGGSGTSGVNAAFTATVENGSVVSVTITNPGTGFIIDDLFVLTFSGGGSDDSAAATATITTDSGVESVLVINGGSQYSALAYVSQSGGSPTVPASFAVVGQNGVVTGISVLNPGLSYSSPPALSVIDTSGSFGSGAVITPVMKSGQISSVTVGTPGTGYTSPPTLTVIGDGSGAVLQADLSGSTVGTINVISGGLGYTKAVIQFNGGNRSAAAVASIMPYGVSGTTVETYSGRVWVGNGRVGQFSSPDDPTDFSAINGAGAFQSTDSFLRKTYIQFTQSNGFLYLFGDSSINYISGVVTGGNPVITTFNNLNVDPQVGTPWHGTVQPFGRDLIFANPVGVFVSYGGAVTKVSDALDGIFTTVSQTDWPAGFTPSAAVMTIFGIRCYILALPILDQITGDQVVKCLMWDGKRWWTSPQEGFISPFIASQDFNSVLTAYCSSNQTTINPMFSASSTNFLRYLSSKLWSQPGIFTTKTTRQMFGLVNINHIDGAASTASGSVFFPANPSPGDTVTFNGIAYAFVASGGSGTNITIDITCGITIAILEARLNASTNPALTVATYAETGGPSDATLHVTYDTTGSAGNAYTMTASAATPSGPTLTGGADGPILYVSSITEHGTSADTSGTTVAFSTTGPSVFGPLPIANPGVLQGVQLKTTMSDIQLNVLTLITQIGQMNT